MVKSPPRPPSPPLGPPRGTYFSRRKARQPLPPSPAFTRILTSSMNMEAAARTAEERQPAGLRYGGDVDELAHAAAVLEFDHARHLGEQCVVLAPANVDARLEFGA